MLSKILPLLFALSTTTSAQEVVNLQKPAVCMETTLILNQIVEDYQELPLWGSKLPQSNIAVFVNHTTKTWTLVQWNENLACVLDTGINYVLNWPGKGA